MKALFLASSVLLSFSSLRPAPALDELKRERLPADVDFVVHVDFEGLKRTELWKRFSEAAEREEMDLNLEELEEIKERFGLDPFTDLRAVTLFKVKEEQEPTVVLFSTTPAIDEALQRFQKEEGYARLFESGIELHSWREVHGENAFAYLHTSGGERVVVLAQEKSGVLRAAQVLRGETPSHARNPELLTLTPAAGSFLYVAAARLPEFGELTPASQVFGLAQGLQVDLGEAGGFLQGHLGMETKTPEDALDVSNMLNGLISMARLAVREAGEALELLTGIRVNARGTAVSLDFEFGVERLLAILESLDADGAPFGPR